MGSKFCHFRVDPFSEGDKIIWQSCLSWKGIHSLLKTYCYLIGITKARLFKFIENFTSKNWEFSDKKKNTKKKNWYFSYFCSKHSLWVLVTTASVPTIYDFEQK